MLNLNLAVAFTGGIVSFFAPCLVPLLPIYIAYVAGISLENLKNHGFRPYIKKILLSSVFYILGFSLIFVALGSVAAQIGFSLRPYDTLVRKVGGVIIFIFGLEFAGILNLQFLAKERRLELPPWLSRVGYLRSFFLGIIFAAAWTPCVGPILGSILTLAIVSKTAIEGATLLFVYSVGISLPFLIVSLTLGWATKYLAFINRYVGIISKIAGLMLAILGILLFIK